MEPIQDSSATGANGNSGSSLSFNLTIGDLGSDGLIIVGATGERLATGSTDQRITGVTFNGVAMRKVADAENNATSNSLSVAMFELHGSDIPAAGTYSVVVSYSGNCDSRTAGAMSFKRVRPKVEEAEGTDNGDEGGQGGAKESLSATLTTQTRKALLVSTFGCQNVDDDPLYTTGDTKLWQANVGSPEDSTNVGGYRVVDIPQSSTVTIEVDNPQSMAIVAASFETVKAGGGFIYNLL